MSNTGPRSAGEWLETAPPMRWRRVFPGRADQVTAARVFASLMLHGVGREEDVAVVVAELATNAVRHSRSGAERGWFGLEITLAQMCTVEVTDLGGGCVPILRTDAPGCEVSTGERGLLMVGKLAVAVGVHGSPQIGHRVWADIDLRAVAGPDTSLAPDSAQAPHTAYRTSAAPDPIHTAGMSLVPATDREVGSVPQPGSIRLGPRGTP